MRGTFFHSSLSFTYNPDLTPILSSIRIIFSIADVQPEEDFEEEPESDSESDVDENGPYPPVRAALSISKVLLFLII